MSDQTDDIDKGNEEKEIEAITQQFQKMYKVCFIAINLLGGSVAIPLELLDKMPVEAELEVTVDEDSGYLNVKAVSPMKLGKKRKRGIIKPNRRLILPR